MKHSETQDKALETAKTANALLQEEIDYEVFGQHLRMVRKRMGLTQAQFSEKMGLKPNFYGEYETGKRHINFPRFLQFVCVTQCSADMLLRGCHKDFPSEGQHAPTYSEKRRELNYLLDQCDDDLITGLIAIVRLLRKNR